MHLRIIFKPIIRLLIILFHIYALIVCFISESEVNNNFKNGFFLKWVPLPLLTFLTIFFYMKVCEGPGFAEKNSDQNSNSGNFFCGECKSYPPLRSGHCKQCKRCILRRDHHCPWMGTCIGLENHFNFIIYLIFECFCLYYFASNAIPAALKDSDLFTWLYSSFQCAIVGGLSILGIIQPIILIPIHIYFALMNKTTWEQARRNRISYFEKWNFSYSPFSKGIFNNLIEFVTMKRKRPLYTIPDKNTILEWKKQNSCLFNDHYELC